jgi:hypothetical protein
MKDLVEQPAWWEMVLAPTRQVGRLNHAAKKAAAD